MFCEMEGFLNGQQIKKLIDKAFEPLMKKYDLKRIELEVLFFLNTYETLDTAKDIVNYKCLSKAHVSKAIEDLSRKHYLAACSCEQDRRCVHLSVTEQAAPIMGEMELIWTNLEHQIYDNISDNERQLLKDIMNKIHHNISRILEDDH